MSRLGWIQVGLGPLGCAIARQAIERGVGPLLGAFDTNRALVGRPVHELVAGAPRDLVVQTTPEELDRAAPVRVAIVATTSKLDLALPTFQTLLGRGIPVVSTCEELAWPWLRHPVIAGELQEYAIRGRASIVAAGVNPGFLMDALPRALVSACRRVERVRIVRRQDAATRRAPFQAKVGATRDAQEFAAELSSGATGHVGLGESLHFLAHALGSRVETWSEAGEPLLAERPLDSVLGPIEPGRVRGLRQIAEARCAGGITLELVFQAAVGEASPEDRITVVGDPSFETVIPGGLHGDLATSALVLNTIRPLIHSEPGLKTLGDLPFGGCDPFD
ncbi:MAG: hypothetical protein WD226_05230 [Planctomycetota bacterium]